MGYDYVLAIKNDNTLWGWGDNGYGNLGIGSSEEMLWPTQVLCPPPLSVTDRTKENFAIYPNPAKQTITIKSLGQGIADEISILDISGKVALKVFHTDQINIENLQSGIYLVKIASGNSSQIEKLIKI